MRPHFAAVAVLCLVSSAHAQKGTPEFPIAELNDCIPKLARAVQLIGMNQVEQSIEQLDLDVNPAFRSPAALEKFRGQWMKLFVPIGRLRMDFETYDIVGYRRVSSQAYFLYGIANGANGPVVFDFRAFRFQGKWHTHGFSFRASGWDRDPKIPDDATILSQPVIYPLGRQPVAKLDTKKTSTKIAGR